MRILRSQISKATRPVRSQIYNECFITNWTTAYCEFKIAFSKHVGHVAWMFLLNKHD